MAQRAIAVIGAQVDGSEAGEQSGLPVALKAIHKTNIELAFLTIAEVHVLALRLYGELVGEGLKEAGATGEGEFARIVHADVGAHEAESAATEIRAACTAAVTITAAARLAIGIGGSRSPAVCANTGSSIQLRRLRAAGPRGTHAARHAARAANPTGPAWPAHSAAQARNLLALLVQRFAQIRQGVALVRLATLQAIQFLA